MFEYIGLPIKAEKRIGFWVSINGKKTYHWPPRLTSIFRFDDWKKGLERVPAFQGTSNYIVFEPLASAMSSLLFFRNRYQVWIPSRCNLQPQEELPHVPMPFNRWAKLCHCFDKIATAAPTSWLFVLVIRLRARLVVCAYRVDVMHGLIQFSVSHQRFC